LSGEYACNKILFSACYYTSYHTAKDIQILEQLRAALSATDSSSPPSYFNFPALDHILSFFHTPQPTIPGVPPNQSSTSPNSTVPGSLRSKPIYPPIIELTSLDTGSGKTHLLYQLIARSVVGSSTHKAAAVLVFDTDNRCSTARLAEIVQAYIITSSSSSVSTGTEASTTIIDDDDHDASIMDDLQTALTHIHIFRPQSLASLISTLHSLPDYLLASPSQHYSSNRTVGLLVLDSASAFFWQERLATDLVSLDEEPDADVALVGSAAGKSSSPTRSSPTRSSRRGTLNNDLAAALRTTQALLGCAVIYTTHTMASTTAVTSLTTTTVPLRTTLPHPISALPSSFPTVRLLCARDTVKKFPAGMTLAQLKVDAPARMAVVAKTGWTASVVPGGKLDEGVRGRMGRSSAARGFVFGVGGVVEDGLGVEAASRR
jgi:DNA-repair protein XRCC2